MKDINKIRKAVATMTNQLYKLGYSLSQAFKTAWKRVKNSMKCRVSGNTYNKRQELRMTSVCSPTLTGSSCASMTRSFSTSHKTFSNIPRLCNSFK